MDAATVTVISGNLVMPKNCFPLRTLQTSHCQLFSKLASIYQSKIPQFKTNFHTSFVSV